MLGHQTPAAIKEFWQHLQRFAPEEIKDHPALESCDLCDLLPLLVHFDGAEMYKNAEYNIWSFSSAFSSLLNVDCIQTQFLCCILPSHCDGNQGGLWGIPIEFHTIYHGSRIYSS